MTIQVGRKQKIIYVITKSNWGGAQRYVFDLADSLARNHEVLVVSGMNGPLLERLREKNIPTISLPSLQRDVNPLFDIKTFIDLVKIFWKEGPDIIHVNSSKIGGIGALAGRLATRSRIIFTAHGWAFNENRSKLSKKLIKFLHWVTVLLSHKTVAVSESMRQQMIGLPFMKDRLVLIYNGISINDFYVPQEAKEQLVKQQTALGFLKDKLHEAKVPWIGTISELHSNKGLEYLIEGLSGIQLPYRMIILGEGEERSTLEKLIKEKGLEQKVFLAGYTPQAHRFLKAFDIFTLTSITEALAYAVIEAGFAERPVLATSVGGVPEIVTQLETGILVQPRNPQEIREGLEYLIEHRERAAKFGRALEISVRAKFDLATMIEKTKIVYHL